MRTLRTTMMCGVAAATMFAAPAMAAECLDELRAYNTEYMESGDYRVTVTPRMQADVRQLRDSVRILDNAGQTEACVAVIEAIRDIVENPQTAEGEAEDAGSADYDTWQSAEIERLQSATDLTEVKGRIRAEDVIGADVRNFNNEDLGEIDDLLLATNQDGQSYVIISEGGFLGIGEEQVAIPMDRLKVTEDMDVFVLNMDEEQFENAPRFERGSYEMLGDEEWQKKNRDFFQTAETPSDMDQDRTESDEPAMDEQTDMDAEQNPDESSSQ